ncbi:glycosyltransferase family 87 protein [Bacillus sp. 123MFChir2]|uniref:glycosyltransferase family 87 protein n=1 Tax=Bacillus sp. 123MFChir2 TaxID=1169144 RepID=UPI00037EB162|nr:glycosyltransferase family 87 protein [Bacillus sp. 123MFChir2]
MVKINVAENKFKLISMIILLGVMSYFVFYKILWNHIIHPEPFVQLYDDFHFFYYSFYTIWHDASIDLLYNLDHQMETFRQLYGGTKGDLGYYMYPPQFAIFLSWFAAFPYEKAKFLWTAFNSMLFVIGVILVIQASYKGTGKGIKYLLFSVAIILFPVHADYFWGQSNRLIFFLLCLTFYFYQSKHKWLAGIPIVLATSFKILPGIFLVYFLFKKEWKVFLSAVITTIVTASITIYVVGWNVVWEYVTKDLFVVNKINEMHGGAPWDSSFKGVLKTYLPHVPISKLHLVYVVLMLIITFLIIKKCQKNSAFEFALVTILMLLFSPVVEVHYPVLMVIVIVFLLAHVFSHSLSEVFENGKKMYCFDLDERSVWHVVLSAIAIAIFLDPPIGMRYFLAMLILFYALLDRYKYAYGQRKE